MRLQCLYLRRYSRINTGRFWNPWQRKRLKAWIKLWLIIWSPVLKWWNINNLDKLKYKSFGHILLDSWKDAIAMFFFHVKKKKHVDLVNYLLNTFRSSSMLGVGWRYGLQIGRRGGGGGSCSGQLIVRLVHGKKKSQVTRAFSGSAIRNRNPCKLTRLKRVQKIMKVVPVPLDWPLWGNYLRQIYKKIRYLTFWSISKFLSTSCKS